MYLGDFPDKTSALQTDGRTDIKGLDRVCQKNFFFFFLYYYFKKLFLIFCDYFLIYKRFAMNSNWWKINWLYQLLQKSLKNAQKTQNPQKGCIPFFAKNKFFFHFYGYLSIESESSWKTASNVFLRISIGQSLWFLWTFLDLYRNLPNFMAIIHHFWWNFQKK